MRFLALVSFIQSVKPIRVKKCGRSGSEDRDSPAARREVTRKNTPLGVRVIRGLFPRRPVSVFALRLRSTRPSEAVAAQRVKFVV